MNNSDQLIIQNQLRNHYKPNLFNYLRRIILLRKCGYIGPGIIIEKNVQVLRYTSNISIGKKVAKIHASLGLVVLDTQRDILNIKVI